MSLARSHRPGHSIRWVKSLASVLSRRGVRIRGTSEASSATLGSQDQPLEPGVRHRAWTGRPRLAAQLSSSHTSKPVLLALLTGRTRTGAVRRRVGRNALADAVDYPHAKPWYRAVFAGGEPVGFVMISWDVEPTPPQIISPWFLVEASHRSAAPGLRLRPGCRAAGRGAGAVPGRDGAADELRTGGRRVGRVLPGGSGSCRRPSSTTTARFIMRLVLA